MGTRARFHAQLVSLLLCTALGTVALHASAEGERQSKEALRLGQTALSLYSQAKWQDALDAFTAADSAMHSPVFGLYRARCEKNLGHWSNARNTLQKAVMSKLPADAPVPWFQAQTAAAEELAEMNSQFPRIEIALAPSESDDVLIELDGVKVELLTGKATQSLDPGTHSLTVSRNSVVLEARDLDLRPTAEPYRLLLGPYQAKSATLPTAAVAIAPSTAPIGTAKPLKAPIGQAVLKTDMGLSSAEAVAYAALGTGILGVCVGAVTGFVAWQTRNNVRADYCNRTYSCPDTATVRDRLNKGRLFANVSTAAFSIAAAGLGAAGVFFYLVPSNSAEKAALGIGFDGRF